MESAGGNWNIPLFDYVTAQLRKRGCEVFNPAEHIREMHGGIERILEMDKETRKMVRNEAMKDEILWIIDTAQMVFLLPGWKTSPGAFAEYAVALAVGVQVHECGNIVLPADGKPLDDSNAKAFDNLQVES
jgi:hypothetical protein